jgi:hypothetical protein
VRIFGNVVALLVASVSFALTLGLVIGLERAVDFDLFSLMWWGFIPVGAFAVGCLAASGYYLGAVKLDVKPTRVAASSIFLVAALLQVALYYSQYAMAKTEEGQAISQLIGFPRFVAWTLSHAKYGLIVNGYRPGGAEGGVEVGVLGYVIAGVQFLALIAAGWVVYFTLSEKPYCDGCSKYLKQTMKLQFPFAGDMATVTELRKIDAPSRPYFQAITRLPPGNAAALELELSTCPTCSREALAERPMFIKDGKLSYQGDAYRTMWNAGAPISQDLASLQTAAPATPTATT